MAFVSITGLNKTTVNTLYRHTIYPIFSVCVCYAVYLLVIHHQNRHYKLDIEQTWDHVIRTLNNLPYGHVTHQNAT